MIRILKNALRSLTPPLLLSWYHFALSYLGALRWGFPTRQLTVIAVTGTKGKSSTAELIFRLLLGSGHKAALLSTIRFAIGETSEPNLFKMTLPGRFFAQAFFARAAKAGATHVVVEITSEAVKQWRHRFIELDALVFTNLAPEHIESHGSFEAYAKAKLSLAHHLEMSAKRPRTIVANTDDAYGEKFLDVVVERRIPYKLADAAPHISDASGSRFTWHSTLFELPLAGEFNILNALAALSLCEAIGLDLVLMQKILRRTESIAGRAEPVALGQDFTVIVDYAHTPESLKAVYGAYAGRRICVLGNTGGGRDRSKRKVMGAIADEACEVSILTDEDPYDEEPHAIIEEMAKGFSKHKPHLILDRREAIKTALRYAKPGDFVLITGKGTDPYIMRARGAKESWSDRGVVEEELRKLLSEKGGNAIS